MTTSTVSAAASSNGVQGPNARSLGQLWQVPAFFIGAIALALVAAAAPLAPRGDDMPLDQDLLTVRRALEKPGLLPDDVVALAESTVAHANRQPDRAGEAHFLLGAVYLRQAERHSPPDKKREERDKAGMHLELAELRGVPEADVARLTYLRGKVAFLVAANMPRAIELLSKSLPGGADNAAEGYAMVVQAHLQGTPPDLDAALAANLKQMEFIDDDVMMAQTRLLRGELLLKKGQRTEAINFLEAIGPKAPQDLRLKARLLQATAAMEEHLWGQAIGWWTELLPYPQTVAGGKGRILYNIGLCCAHHEPPNHDKEAITAWRETQLYGNEEAQAAALRLAELR
ncbi:MAG TPA: hypothetical protein VE988_29790, partial [Gemmataceae bacterium]|nr:hypothetical protein [Gemmataceae bacterium]